jgi:hypothetical protein
MSKKFKFKKLEKKITRKHLTMREAADLSGVTPQAIDLAINRGDLNCTFINHKKRIAVDVLWETYKKKQKEKGKQPNASGIAKNDDVEDGFSDKKRYEQYKDIKYKAAMRQLDYAERLKTLVDVETVRHSFTPFVEALYNNLIYIPDKIDDSETAAMVKDLISVAIKKAKEESDKILPPKSRKYIFLDDEDEK